MKDPYPAHFIKKEDGTIDIQTVSEHNFNVAELMRRLCILDELINIAWVTGVIHDGGKYRDAFKEYIERAMREEIVHRGEVDHSTGGGWLLEQLLPHSIKSEFIEIAVYSHHGIQDCINLSNGEVLKYKRLEKNEQVDQVWERFFQYSQKSEMEERISKVQKDFERIIKKIRALTDDNFYLYGSKHFYLGMYERVLLSLLIDADRTDTSRFAQQLPPYVPLQKETFAGIWDPCIAFMEAYLGSLKGSSVLDQYRREISECCKKAAEQPWWLYRLTVPTGAGKTLSSLRFALYHASKFHKKHIIYVAPYLSIVDQNADEIRRAVGNPNLVLEHHSNVIFESEKEQERYEALIESWDESPVIVTTAVQLLNTLFTARSSNIRRMHNLLNSVIIFDEVQAMPVKVIKLFNLAVNFLTQFGMSTVVLCSATQPLLDELPRERMVRPRNMVEDMKQFEEAFKRTDIIDKTHIRPSGFSIEECRDFVFEQFEKEKQVLVIVNTKVCAERLYHSLKDQCDQSGCRLFHLSTNMCMENRRQVLADMREILADKQQICPMICISTQLIEAGVDISFRCVIRSLAGLDSIIQAAGRCNRNKEVQMGKVFVIRMNREAENLDHLPDIRKAQEIMMQVLDQFKIQRRVPKDGLDSKEVIDFYYVKYQRIRLQEMEYLVYTENEQDTIVNLLSENEKTWEAFQEKNREKRIALKQAFKTAGDLFEVIEEDGKIDVVVEYDENAKAQIDKLRNPYLPENEKKHVLRDLQRYTVGISKQKKDRLGQAVSGVCEGAVLVLSENYYSRETGVSEEPVGMEFMNY